MIISIASGKGGTGKTTVATNLALSVEEKVQFLDCDVEEPNAHLFLTPHFDSKEKVYVPVPHVDEEMCSHCKMCSEICRFNAITVIGQRVLTFPELCHGCGGCMEVCPTGALTEKGREIGDLETGTAHSITFSHGRTRIGEAMSPPLIQKVREKTLQDEITIIDAPPGTSCPVITAVRGVDFVLLVTEPTPFGLHDLQLAVETMRHLNLPCGLVINRAGVGNTDVYDYAEEMHLPILLEIPFSREIAAIYSQGKILVEEKMEWKHTFLQLFKSICKQIHQQRDSIQ